MLLAQNMAVSLIAVLRAHLDSKLHYGAPTHETEYQTGV